MNDLTAAADTCLTARNETESAHGALPVSPVWGSARRPVGLPGLVITLAGVGVGQVDETCCLRSIWGFFGELPAKEVAG